MSTTLLARRTAWQRSLAALRRFYKSDVGRPAIAWSVALLGILLSINGLNVLNSYVGRDLMTAIAERRPAGFVRYAIFTVGVFAALTTAAALSRFSEERLRLLWRTWMTRALISGYLSNRAYYRLLTERSEVDNPDQRLTDDVKAYTQTTLSFFLLMLNATITSLAFLGVLWSITPWLVVAAVAYAAAGSAATVLLGRPLVPLNNLQLKKEADLRYQLIRVREAAVPIAVIGAERSTLRRLLDRLGAVVDNYKAIIAVTRNLGFFTNGYNYLIQLIPVLIVAPLYMRGRVEFGVVTQSAMAFDQVVRGLSLIVTQFETISTFAAVTDRLNTVAEAIEQARTPAPCDIEVEPGEGRVAYEGLTLWTPKEHRTLLDGLDLTVEEGDTLLVTGPNGEAREALFLATAGVCESGRGKIVRPPTGRVAFVPHRGLVGEGTLRDQLLIRGPAGEFTADAVVDALRTVGLESLVDRGVDIDTVHDWGSVLSPGERHRLAVAGLLLARPRFAFLDRTTEGLGPEQVALVYKALADASITCVTFGDGEDEALRTFHDHVLEIQDDGRWQEAPGRGETAA